MKRKAKPARRWVAWVFGIAWVCSTVAWFLAARPSEIEKVQAYGKQVCKELGTDEYEVVVGFKGDEMTDAGGRCGAKQPGLQANSH